MLADPITQNKMSHLARRTSQNEKKRQRSRDMILESCTGYTNPMMVQRQKRTPYPGYHANPSRRMFVLRDSNMCDACQSAMCLQQPEGKDAEDDAPKISSPPQRPKNRP
tara:strand:- start:33997 stop:34323 length:327 start_codon:yes stop_codon:yes gene_type:complete